MNSGGRVACGWLAVALQMHADDDGQRNYERKGK
jgi:hypothetical protein